MNRLVAYFVLLSILFTAATSSTQFGFHSILGVFTSAPTTTSTSQQFANFSASPTTSNDSSGSSSASESVNLTRISLTAAATAISTFESTYTNWVGPVATPTDTACYRESHIGKTCPLEFNSKWDTCWAQCPLDYPVKCGMECIRQNDDCKLDVVSKVAYVFQSVVALSLYNIYGEFKLMAKAVQVAFRCAKEMANLVKQLSKYIRNVTVTDPQTLSDQLLDKMYQTDNVLFDVPVTVASCLGIPADPEIRIWDKITNTGELILKEVIADKELIIASWESFTSFMKKVALGESLDGLNKTEITSLVSAMKSNTTCGFDMKRLADRTCYLFANKIRKCP